MFSFNLFPFQVYAKITPVFMVGIFTVFGALGTMIIACSRSPISESTVTETSESLDLSKTQLRQYARAVLLFEPYRQQAIEKIKTIIGKPPPNILCNQPSSFNTLPPEAQKVAENYCKISKKIVEDSGLSVVIFNRITMRLQTDETLRTQVQNVMVEIQQQQPSDPDSSPVNRN